MRMRNQASWGYVFRSSKARKFLCGHWTGLPSLKLKGVCFLDLKEYKSGVDKFGSVKIPCSTISSRVCAVGKENTDLDTMVEVISYWLVLLVTFDSVCFVSVRKVSISFLISDLVRLAPLMQGLVILESVIERSIVVLTDLGSGFLQ
ncbi:hypothetical protein YC2023_054562 [Brassica napus]